MPKITQVEPQTLRLRSRRRFNIYLDGQFAFGADEDLVVEYRLIVGKLLDTSDVEKLLFEAEVGKLMERIYRLWNIRPRSEREVKDYLRKLSYKRKIKGKEEISEAAVELLINKLQQKGLLSDEQFAKMWVEARRKSKLKGKIALKAELFQKGIDREIIEEVLGEETPGVSEEQLAREALAKKVRAWDKLIPLEFKKKAYGFLLRRGFEYEVVRDAVEKYLNKR